MAIKVVGSTSGNVAEVDAGNNLAVTLPTDVSRTGFVNIVGELSDATAPAGRVLQKAQVSRDGKQKVGLDQILFNLTFEGTNISQAHIQQNLSTMTATQTGGFLVLNNGNAVASGNAANIRTYRTFPINQGNFPSNGIFELKIVNIGTANVIKEWGFGFVSGTSAPTDGVFFRIDSSGVFKAVVNYAGSETINTISTLPTDNVSNSYKITIHNEECFFYMNGVLQTRITIPNTQPNATSSSSLPLFARVYNTNAASPAVQIAIGQLAAVSGDDNTDKPWSHVMAGAGGGCYQIQPGTASGQTANWSNSAAPGSATLSNTAAGYTTLGGQWQFAALATNETDWALFGYTNPAGSSTLTGKTLYITGVHISTVNTGAANAATATTLF